MPPEGSEMEVRYINARKKRGFGTKKVAKQARDEESNPKEGEFEWGNANPEHRGVYGHTPCPNIAEDGYRKKYWEGQTRELEKETTANMLYKATYCQFYSSLQEVPYALWHVGKDMPSFPYQWQDGERNPYFGMMFDPILTSSDGQDGCLRQLVGNGPYGIADLEVAWC